MKKLLVSILAIIPLILHAQTLEEARQLYLKHDFKAAIATFEKAVAENPKNASYNQWYGTCLVETGRMAEATPYLQFAASKNIIEAHNSLGKMYFLMYQFDKAAEAYQTYEQRLIEDKQTQKAETVRELIGRSQRAARMLSRCEDVQIVDSVVVGKDDFLSAYKLGESAGTLKMTNAFVRYENQLADRRVYGKPDEYNNTQLYTQSKIQDTWTDEHLLALPIDSASSVDFPFLMPDGLTIYFAADGNGSIGGYDLFVSRRNLNNDAYLAPNQMGMPFNSIYNDFMLAIDEENNIGYFASDRYQPEDKVIIYTFIPNSEYMPLNEDIEAETLIDRAKITSISDTWKPNFDQAKFLSALKNSLEGVKPQKVKNFTFVIDDNTVYYALTDFKSDAAKDYFAKTQDLKKSIEHLEAELDAQRLDFKSGDAVKKQTLKPQILASEKRLETLFADYRNAVKETRNLEVNFLGIRN
ncbi:MAG: tetratricopeptide repeat protein [Dysgonamonadaceae bacterium]|jgi:Tfp pilus assembly protein PilF|nr:tetratricopeptide repeat protein [Dysgonamonadaceae bacterium]